MFSILSARKNFNDRWIGNPALNRAGLHRLRLRAAAQATRVRRAQVLGRRDDAARALIDKGIAVIPDFLPVEAFHRVREEARKAAALAERDVDPEAGDRAGFGPKRDHPWGFDRSDGGTLNRFITLDGQTMPGCSALARDKRLRVLSRAVTGIAVPAKFSWIYQTFNGDEVKTPDVQRALHRDTFFDSMKYWYFIEPVSLDDGPFEYVQSSHHLTAERLDWEFEIAQVGWTAAQKGPGNFTEAEKLAVGGSFRIDESELERLNLPQVTSYPGAANTLVMANTFGFHRRGQATPGTRRLAIYGNRRPKLPFGLIGL